MAIELPAPTIELLAWLSERTRSYDEAIEAWSSHCPRLTVWEDAFIDRLVHIERDGEGGATVRLTTRGTAALVAEHRV